MDEISQKRERVSKRVWFSRAWVDVRMVGTSTMPEIWEEFGT